METIRKNKTATIAVIGSIILAVILVAGTIWMGQSARRDTEEAVHSVSLLYLDELAGRRVQVVEKNLEDKINTIQVAIELMTEEDLSDEEHLQAYQKRMKKLYNLDKFAFVDEQGMIHTSNGIRHNIKDYGIDYKNLKEPLIKVVNLGSKDKKVIVAVPVDLPFMNTRLKVCFMEIAMKEMLSGVSMTTDTKGSTFCNIYTRDGVALADAVLGGLAEEDNLLDAMQHAKFEPPYTYEEFVQEFQAGKSGAVTFTYNDIRETLAYIPVAGTGWQLTYLIRESVISDTISSISDGAVKKSIIQSLFTMFALLLIIAFIYVQLKRNSRLELEKETEATESRVKQEELEHRLELQEKLLEEERQREQQNNMITALSSDYWSVYYLDLDADEGICYQSHRDLDGTGFKEGEKFRYMESVKAYAQKYVDESSREEFLQFVQPEHIREGLLEHSVLSYTYKVHRHDKVSYESARFAGVRHLEDRDDGIVHKVGACFADTDAETRRTMAEHQALNDAIRAAEQANKAKTTFLSNMSHEIRTPMNAIIGLDSIALNDPETPEKTKDYLQKIAASADHLLGLINDILDMSRIESGRMTLKHEEFSFARMLKAINTMFSGQAAGKGLDYQCHINSEVDDYYIGDDMKLRQMLINVLGNAIKFTPEGGRVDLEVERKARFNGRSMMQFRISDTGIGISEEFMPRLFDTFAQEDGSSTNKYGSSGLGLAITKSIAEMMNGNITVESEKGKGSVFTITVSLADADHKKATDNLDDIRPSDMSVLIVDDDPVACEHARLVLERVGIESEISTSGAEAVEMVRMHHMRREPYNLILVDWQMPEMDGVETTRQMREIIGHESAIIILTAYNWDDILEEALEAGVDTFLPKPLFAGDIIEEFRSAMRHRLAADKGHKADLSGRHLLLAEDVEINAEIMKMILEARGMTMDLAVNGLEAVNKFVDHEPGYYDAILMDVRMPEMDGLEATRTIRAMNRPDAKEIPIIALTANAFDEDVQRSLQAGLNAHLTKPIQPELLYETLEGMIAE